MAFDYKEEYPEFYGAKKKPSMVNVPKMNYVAVLGEGRPRRDAGDYYPARESVLAVTQTILKCKELGKKVKGFFAYEEPPIETFFWCDQLEKLDYVGKENAHWAVAVRIPDFVTPEILDWAIEETRKHKPLMAVQYYTYHEGVCVQALHVGVPETEMNTVALMKAYVNECGFSLREKEYYHHEIYLNDILRCKRENWRIILRQPVDTVADD